MEMNKRVEKATDQAKKFGDDVMNMGRNVWLAGLGAYSWAEEETRKTFDDLVDRGQKFEKDEKNVVSKTIDDATTKAKDFGTKVEDTVHDTVTTVLHRAGVPSRDEIGTLIQRVEELTKKVDKLQAS
jgi:poly(hydroxyalkanoate) granule-associated protein